MALPGEQRRFCCTTITRHKVVYSDAECAIMVSTFCQFFVDNVNRIRDSIAVELQSTVWRLFTARPYHRSDAVVIPVGDD